MLGAQWGAPSTQSLGPLKSSGGGERRRCYIRIFTIYPADIVAAGGIFVPLEGLLEELVGI
jgi:hypothetical protein